MTDADYIYAFQQVVMPIAHEFKPDFVIGASFLLSVSMTMADLCAQSRRDTTLRLEMSSET